MASFSLQYVGIIISSAPNVGLARDLIELQVLDVQLRRFVQRAFDMTVNVGLGALNIVDLTRRMAPMGGLPNAGVPQALDTAYLVCSNPAQTWDGAAREAGTVATALIEVTFVQAAAPSPIFATTHKSTKQTIRAVFGDLRICAHQPTLHDLMAFGVTLSRAVGDVTSGDASVILPGEESSKKEVQEPVPVAVAEVAGVVDVALSATLGSLELVLSTAKQTVSVFTLNGVTAAVSVGPAVTTAVAQLNGLRIQVLLTTPGVHGGGVEWRAVVEVRVVAWRRCGA